MVSPGIHHVLVPAIDLEESRRFYRDVLELREIARPNFKFPGAWFQFGGGQHLHLAVREETLSRGNRPVDSADVHYALGMSSYTKTVAWLHSKGFSEDLPAEHMQKMILRPDSIVGRPQIYIIDPAHNVIEFICDALD